MNKDGGKTYKKIGGSINDWANSLEEVGLQELAERLSEGEEVKMAGLKKLEELALPHLKRETIKLSSFLVNPKKYFEHLNSQKFYVNLVGGISAKVRMRSINLTRSQVLQFISDNVKKLETEYFTLILSEYYNNIYGGNIVVNFAGSYLLELAKGTHSELVTGEKKPCLLAEGDNVRNICITTNVKGLEKVDNETEIKDAVIKTLACIPTVDVKGKLFPGYYEFVLVVKTDGASLSPIFLDYRDADFYQIRA